MLCTISPLLAARPYPFLSGLTAAADNAMTAGTNPAGITRFKERAFDAEILWFASESEWESAFSEEDIQYNSKDSGDTVVPRIAFVQPINDDFTFSFTFLGAGFSDDFGDNWPGRYFIIEYESLYVSAFPSIAYRLNEQWSVAGSVSITYTSFEQERAIRNIADPGFGDGRSSLEADSTEFGFGLSTLYEMSDRTRFGLSYQSEIEPSQDADASFKNIGPRTSAIMDEIGIFDADITLESTSPQSVLFGLYHEFENDHAVTLDLAWLDFSEFSLSEYYFNGEALAETYTEYNDIYAAAVSYTFPVSNRWMLGVGGALTNELVDDDNRTMALRLDAIWTLGVAAQYQWTDERSVRASLSYIAAGDAPVETGEIPGLGSLQGEFESRDTVLFQIGMSFGGL
jgi:long-chain fatty acid transport protein